MCVFILQVRSHAELKMLLAGPSAPLRAVVQEYLPTPLLLDGLKFDLRLYVIVTCASPLRAFLSTRGVARLATHEWQPVSADNQHDQLMHLSNSTINEVRLDLRSLVVVIRFHPIGVCTRVPWYSAFGRLYATPFLPSAGS